MVFSRIMRERMCIGVGVYACGYLRMGACIMRVYLCMHYAYVCAGECVLRRCICVPTLALCVRECLRAYVCVLAYVRCVVYVLVCIA